MPRRPRLRRTRRERDTPAGASRIRILEGAMRAFGEHGYKDTRVEDILRAAGVSRPTFYKFFANRDEVFDAIAESQAFAVIQAMKGAIDMASDPLEKLDRALEAYLRWRAAIGPIGTVLNAEAMRPGTHASLQRQAILDAVTSWFATEADQVVGEEVDRLVYVGLVAALERIGAELDHKRRVGEKDIQRCKRAMLQIVLGTLAWGRDLDALLGRIESLRDAGGANT